MEPWQVAFITLYGGLLAWLLYSQHTQGKQIVTITTTMNMFIQSIDTDIKEIRQKQLELDNKLNLFLKNELDTLKDLARSTRIKAR